MTHYYSWLWTIEKVTCSCDLKHLLQSLDGLHFGVFVHFHYHDDALKQEVSWSSTLTLPTADEKVRTAEEPWHTFSSLQCACVCVCSPVLVYGAAQRDNCSGEECHTGSEIIRQQHFCHLFDYPTEHYKGVHRLLPPCQLCLNSDWTPWLHEQKRPRGPRGTTIWQFTAMRQSGGINVICSRSHILFSVTQLAALGETDYSQGLRAIMWLMVVYASFFCLILT